MWNPISIDKFVKVHLKKNPNDNEKALKVRIEAALDVYGISQNVITSEELIFEVAICVLRA